MRLIAMDGKDGGLGIVEGSAVVKVADLSGERLPRSVAEAARDPGAIARLAAALKTSPSAPRTPLASIEPGLPFERGGKFICLGLNYAEHAKEGGHKVQDTFPALFQRVFSSLCPAGAPVIRPRVSEQLDFEAELAVIIGKGGRHIPEAQALDHVFGYTLFNDVSVRDYQRKTTQWLAGKNFDATGPLGPVVVTADELPAGAKGLRIQSRLNGQVMQDANTDDMIFTVARTIAILSEVMTLEPGDTIATGTPSGVGHARKPPVWMKPGDRIEIEVERVGVLANPIADEARG